MTTAPAARALLAIAFGLFACSCVLVNSNPVITAEPDSAILKKRFLRQLEDLELATGKRYRGKTIHINSPVPAIYRDWRMMPVAKIRGRRQGGLTSWRANPGHTSVYLASWRGETPSWLIRPRGTAHGPALPSHHRPPLALRQPVRQILLVDARVLFPGEVEGRCGESLPAHCPCCAVPLRAPARNQTLRSLLPAARCAASSSICSTRSLPAEPARTRIVRAR